MAPVIRLRDVSLTFGATRALDAISLDFPAGAITGVVGPDGVGKSTMFSLIAGARVIEAGQIEVLGGDMAQAGHRQAVCPRIAFMPQGLGRNLYATLSVTENLEFFGRLFGQDKAERDARISGLLRSTGLETFRDRPAGKLSGGMKQKLGLCCALIHDPDLLILDEPTTGVDPLSRRQFWELIATIRAARPAMSVVVATAYMEEAAAFDHLVAMNAGHILATGTAAQFLKRTATASLEEAFIALLPEAQQQGHRAVIIPKRPPGTGETVIEARGLTRRFGDFTAVDHVDFNIKRGEIFGFLGSNGCGKTTTMKMLTGLLPASEGEAFLFGQRVTEVDMEMRRKVGFMSQDFSLYSELSVEQNLVLQAQLFNLPSASVAGRVSDMLTRFQIADVADAMPDDLPLGVRQRLSLAAAVIPSPAMLILDEPTSGVDPIARDMFWQMTADLSRNDGVTIFISTHFMNEAQRCDRISLMNAGRVLICDTPANVIKSRNATTLEEAFIATLQDAEGITAPAAPAAPLPPETPAARPRLWHGFSLRRLWSYTVREVLELRRDPIRSTLALFGSVLLMLILAYGLNLDVDRVRFAVLDQDDSVLSRDYVINIAGSPSFRLQPPIRDHAELDHRLQSADIAVAFELPPNFGRDLDRGTQTSIGVWIDGAMPYRGETVQSYVVGIHTQWIAGIARRRLGAAAAASLAVVDIATRFRYNPDNLSVVAMAPAMIPLLLLMIPAMLTALSVVREKELGSIVNLYVTPVTRAEFLIGKQLPYVVLGIVNFLLLTLMATALFGVPLTGDFATLAASALVFVLFSTSFGLLMSTFMNTQIAAIFGTALGTIIPAVQFAGLINPISSLAGIGRVIGVLHPVTYFLVICRAVFSKGLGLLELWPSMLPIAGSVLVLMGLCIILLKKQEG